jgi:hypothetical protein
MTATQIGRRMASILASARAQRAGVPGPELESKAYSVVRGRGVGIFPASIAIPRQPQEGWKYRMEYFPLYSYRSATVGSSLEARRAGANIATMLASTTKIPTIP